MFVEETLHLQHLFFPVYLHIFNSRYPTTLSHHHAIFPYHLLHRRIRTPRPQLRCRQQWLAYNPRDRLRSLDRSPTGGICARLRMRHRARNNPACLSHRSWRQSGRQSGRHRPRPGMLAEARKKPIHEYSAPITWLQGDVTSLSSTPEIQSILSCRGGFDIISLCSGLVLLPNQSAAIKYWARLLRPGGRMIIDVLAEKQISPIHLQRRPA